MILAKQNFWVTSIGQTSSTDFYLLTQLLHVPHFMKLSQNQIFFKMNFKLMKI